MGVGKTWVKKRPSLCWRPYSEDASSAKRSEKSKRLIL